ncbi:MAG: hypothetical protein IT384_09140 [Deltaproteobacteria bacterium]|nr:hypothetical protein [Deltaproteobacteria bacterium]
MGVIETALFYLLIGAAVGAALLLRETRSSLTARVALASLGVLCWPFFAALLLARSHPPETTAGPHGSPLDLRISQAERVLEQALERLDLATSELVAREVERVRHLVDPLRAMAHRLAEMDALLAAPEFDREQAARRFAALESSARGDDPRLETLRARLRNIDRLERMRAQTETALDRALLELEELGAQVRLLKFAGRTDEEVLERLRAIAAGIEGLAEELWSAA